MTTFQQQMLDTGSLDMHFLLLHMIVVLNHPLFSKLNKSVNLSYLFWNFYSTTLPICNFTLQCYHSATLLFSPATLLLYLSTILPLTTCSYSDSKIQLAVVIKLYPKLKHFLKELNLTIKVYLTISMFPFGHEIDNIEYNCQTHSPNKPLKLSNELL